MSGRGLVNVLRSSINSSPLAVVINYYRITALAQNALYKMVRYKRSLLDAIRWLRLRPDYVEVALLNEELRFFNADSLCIHHYDSPEASMSSPQESLPVVDAFAW
jgi:hypothetical protein